MLGSTIRLVDSGTISGKIAKTVVEGVYRTGKSAEEIIKENNLVQITDLTAIEKIIDKIIESNPEPVKQYRAGKVGTIGWFVGQVMRETSGRANPKSVNELLRKKLAG